MSACVFLCGYLCVHVRMHTHVCVHMHECVRVCGGREGSGGSVQANNGDVLAADED